MVGSVREREGFRGWRDRERWRRAGSMAAGRAECVAIRTACPGKYEASWLRVSVVASPLPCRSSQLVARSCWQSQQSGRVLSAWLTLSRSAAGGERTGQRARGGREGDRCGPAESDTRRGARVQVGQIHECRTWELGVAVAVAAVLRELRVVRVLGCLRCLRCLALLRLSIRGGRETQWQGGRVVSGGGEAAGQECLERAGTPTVLNRRASAVPTRAATRGQGIRMPRCPRRAADGPADG